MTGTPPMRPGRPHTGTRCSPWAQFMADTPVPACLGPSKTMQCTTTVEGALSLTQSPFWWLPVNPNRPPYSCAVVTKKGEARASESKEGASAWVRMGAQRPAGVAGCAYNNHPPLQKATSRAVKMGISALQGREVCEYIAFQKEG